MSTDHDVLLADLRVLADTVLDRLEGIVAQIGDPATTRVDCDAATTRVDCDAATTRVDCDAATTRVDGDPAAPTEPAAASCAWCPLCALAALVRGEKHELLTRLATQIAALIAMIRELLARFLPARSGSGDGPDVPPPTTPPDHGGFERISVTIRS